MDKDVNQKNASLYNKHALQHATQDEAKQKREQGMAAPLKKFHNSIKFRLIQRFAGDSAKLLDLACGRGGDLHKWIRCGVAYARGFDIAEQEVEEARVRLAGALAEGSGQYAQGGFSADFLATQDIGDKVWVDEKAPYDAVTCMFALHYFFRSEKSARNALEMAAKNLRPGGHFFGVLPDGKNVLNAIGEDMQPREWRAVRLAPRWQGVPRPFGSAYTCALTDTVTEGGEDGEGSFEYLVYQKVLVALAAQFDLHPVKDYEDFQLDDVLEEPVKSSDGSALFRRFKSNFPGSHPSLELASKLNCAFVFRKGAPEHGAPVQRGARADGAAAGHKRQRVEQADEALAEAVPGAGGAQDEAERQRQKMREVSASYGAPQFKRSSKFKQAR